MEYQEFIESIEKRLNYRGRAMAFYEDGRDYGVVTVMSAKASHHMFASHVCFVYSETSSELVGTAKTGAHVNVAQQEFHTKREIFEVKSASCGRKYVLTCDGKDGQTIYIGEFF